MSEKFKNFLKKKIGIENFFKKKDLEVFGTSEICYLIVKGVNSKSFESYFRSVLIEKKKFFKDGSFNSHLIKKKLEIFIKNNHPISTYFLKITGLTGKIF